MPTNPFVKSYNPTAPIDLSLFSHINDDAFLAGTYDLEGNHFKRTINYLNGFCDYLAAGKGQPEEIVALRKRMNQLVEIEMRLVEIRDSAFMLDKSALTTLSASIATDLLEKLKVDEYLSMPGGWLDPSGGHAMMYQFKRTDTGLEFYVHNAGAGLQYHERHSDPDRELYYPVQAYKIPSPLDLKKIAAFLHDLMLPQLPELREAKDQHFDEKELYENVLPRISFLNGELMSMAGKMVEHARTAGQLSGTCSQRSLHQMLKQSFKTLPEYQRFIYQFKRYALDNYIKVLTDENGLHDRRVQKLIKHAMNTMVRTLNIPGLFSGLFIGSERTALRGIKELLQASLAKDDAASAKAMVHPGAVDTSFVITAPPIALRPAASSPGVRLRVDVAPAKTIPGGDGLLTQMEAFLQECERLRRAGQYPAAIEQLERAFINFPLPTAAQDFKHPLDFYKAIKAENQAKFYELISSLHESYSASCKALSSDAALPRMVVTGLSVVSILDYVTHQFPLCAAGSPSFHDVTRGILGRFFEGNRSNPYFATNSPALDARLQSIKSLYPTTYGDQVLAYYLGILNSEPALKARLLTRYVAPANTDFARLLIDGGLRELYWLTTDLAQLSTIEEFKPLIKKFDLQRSIEQGALKALKMFWATQNDIYQPISLIHKADDIDPHVEIRSKAYNTMFSCLDGQLIKHKYGLENDTPCKRALGVDFYVRGEGKAFDTMRSDNQIQMLPSDVVRTRWIEVKTKARAAMAVRQIDGSEIADRELLHLRGSSQSQIKLTIDYFQRHLAKLTDPAYKIYMEANIFEPGLLLAELDKNPAIFPQIDSFIDAGLKHFAERGFTSQHSLFFIRLAYLVNRYAAEHKPDVAYKRLQALQQRLTAFLQLDKENDPAIKQSLHQYQFLTAMARLKLKPGGAVTAEERQSILEIALPSYFYMNAKSNPTAFVDTASQFELNCVKHDFKQLVAQSTPVQIGPLVRKAMNDLGIGVCADEPRIEGTSYRVLMREGATAQPYTVDVGCALFFNDKGMAYSPIPLDILHHPVLQYLNYKSLEPCFTSSDGLVFELGDPAIRFIRQTPTSKYRVQKKWNVGYVSSWYELHDLSPVQKLAFGLDTTTIAINFADTLKQRDSQIWVNCVEANNILLTDNNRPSYQFKNESYGRMVAKQLNDAGAENGFILCSGKTWLHNYFAQFEDAAFTTVSKKGGTYQVKFGRYGITLLANEEMGAWVFRLQDNPSYILVGDTDTLLTGVSGLIFEDKTTSQRSCYLPLQQFTCAGGPSPHSEFHNLKLDIAGRIPKHVVSKLPVAAATLLPWQYSGSERVVRYQLDKTGQPMAETPIDALYLCYIYLGSQQPEKAWSVLEDCVKRLGGLNGTAEELAMLNWIINALPRQLNDEDSKAKIETPAYVACQLKALALFTGAFTPDKTISFPGKAFDLKTPDGLYQNKCLEDVQSFHDGLNTTLYRLYSRYQSMQRHLEHGFQLNDNERKSLLEYYHFNLPGDDAKALGALGYEWQTLRLKALRKEYTALTAAAGHGLLTDGYKLRLAEINKCIKKETIIRAHHTELALLPIDLSIPISMKGGTFEFSSSVSWNIHKWWNDINKRAPVAQDTYLAALTPDITEDQLYDFFPFYYKLVMDATPTAPQARLVDFCRKYLIAHRYTPLDKQPSKTTYLCNILYRISQNRASFALYDYKGLVDILYYAQNTLPDPVISVFQARQTTTDALAGTSVIWDGLADKVLAPGRPMVAELCEGLARFSEKELTRGFGLEDASVAYRKQAKIFGAPSSEPVAVDPSEPRILNSAELLAGKAQYDALQEMKKIAGALTDPTLRRGLQTRAQAFIEQLGRVQQDQLAMILDLANSGPAEPTKKRRRDLELDGAVRAPLDIQRLLALYYSADKVRYAVETGLSETQIEKLHTQLSHYLAYSVRQQAMQRLCKQLEKTGPVATPSTLQQIAHELLTDDLVDYRTEPVLAILQHYENILLRPQQINAIKRLLTAPSFDRYAFMEAIEKIIMGGGKSKVILPILAQSKVTGNNLVVIEVQRSLFETNCTDLTSTSGRLFNQKACPFEFNRDSNCSPESLQFLYEKLIDVIVSRDYLVTTGDAVQSLELKYLEIVLQRPEDAEERKLWAKQVEWLDKIVTLFRTRADVVMDEVHNGLLLKKKLNYTLGEQRAVSSSIIAECVELFRFFDSVSLGGALGDAFADKSVANLLQNNQLITQDAQWKAVLANLSQALMEHTASPLKNTLQRMVPKLTDADRVNLLAYLRNEGDNIPACVLRCDIKTRTVFALYKEQVSQLLPHTLKRKLNENYGAPKMDGLAIPYVANNVPSERSRFGNYLEAINFSIQMLMIEGFKPALLKKYLSQLQEQARQELFKQPDLVTIDNTPTAKGFQAWTTELRLGLSQIHLDDEVQFNTVFSALRRNKELLCEVLKTDVLPQIRVEAEILHSDAFNHVDIYRSCQGVTGTPSNSSTYHQRLSYDPNTAAATDGFIVNVLEEKHTTICQVPHASPAAFLNGVFAGRNADELVRAIIDICAAFKGISNIAVAKELAIYTKAHPAQFEKPSPLKYILFFNEENVLCALEIQEGNTPIVIGSTDPEVINAKLGCTPDARISYYDQSHTVGIDLKQADCAKALVLVDHETHLQSFLQGCLRMRGLQDEQKVEIIVPANMGTPSLEVLIKQMATNEEQQLQKDNFSAAQAKMINLIRADFMKRLLALPSEDVENKNRYALAFKSYFVEQASLDFFAVYGGLSSLRSSRDILEERSEHLFSDWSEILMGLHAPVEATDRTKLQENLDQIIIGALPRCQTAYLSPTRQEQGREVEVQKQVQVELQKEAQLERVVFNPTLEPFPYQPWAPYFTKMTTPYSFQWGVLSLSTLCSQRSATAPKFDNIYVGPNYYQSYKGQAQFIGAFLKPVHALLFHKHPDGTLECMILSQQEAEELTTRLATFPDPTLWISTTQHTLLAGQFPAGMKESVAYLDMIEKVRFFNGELNLLLDGELPLNWLREETGQKLAFFERYIMPYRETANNDLVALRQASSQRQNAFRYIAEHPQEDYTDFEWRTISEELTEADIEECVKLTQAFGNANLHWRERDFDKKKCQDNLRLSLQASAYINRYFDEQLTLLRGAFPLCLEGSVEAIKADIDSLLPMLIKEYVPLIRARKQTPLQFVLKKATIERDNPALMRVAEWLLEKGAAIDAKDGDGYTALELVIQDAGERVSESVRWLLNKVAKTWVSPQVWARVNPKTLEKFLDYPEFRTNDQFILAYVEAFQNDITKLQNIMSSAAVPLNILQKIVQVIHDPTKDFLAKLLAHPLFKTNAALVNQLLEKVNEDTRQWILSRLTSTPDIQPDVLSVILAKTTDCSVDNYRRIFHMHSPILREDHLNAMLGTLPKNCRERPSEQLIGFLQQIVGHARVSPAVLDAAVIYTLPLELLYKCKIFDRQRAIFAENPLYQMVSNLPGTWDSRLLEQLPKIMNYVNRDTSMLEVVVQYVLNFDQNNEDVARLWTEYLIFQPWDKFSASMLSKMFLTLPQKVTIGLFRSVVFATNKADIINKLIENGDPALFNMLLKSKLAGLDSILLMKFLKAIDATHLQAILPQIMLHQSANQALLKECFILMQKPAKMDLLRAMLASEELMYRETLLEGILRALVIDEVTSTSAEAIDLLQRIAIQEGVDPGLLGAALTYALKFEPRLLARFWTDFLAHQQWEALDASKLCEIFLALPKEDVEALFSSPVFIANKESITDKLVQSGNSNIYRLLLESRQITLTKAHLLGFLRTDATAILPQIVGHPAVVPVILLKIIETMRAPNQLLLKALLANNLVLKNSDLFKAMLKSLTIEGEAIPGEGTIELLQRVVDQVPATPAVLEVAVAFALTVERAHLPGFWRNLSLQKWEWFNTPTLVSMFLTLPDDVIDGLFSSPTFVEAPENTISRLILGNNAALDRLLISNTQVRLKAHHLLRLAKVDRQELLALIVGHAAADASVFGQVIEVMRVPPEAEILRALLANHKFITNTGLVEKLLGKVDGENRQLVLSHLSTKADVSVEVLDTLVKESKSNVERLTTIINQHNTRLTLVHLKAMLPRNRQEAEVWRRQIAHVPALLSAIIKHKNADPAVLKDLFQCALAIVPADSRFWRTIPQHITQLDLSKNNLGKKDSTKLQEILAVLPETIESLDLSENNIDTKLMPILLAITPPSVTHIAYEQHNFMTRAEINAKFTDHAFLFNCLSSIGLVAGGALFLAGLVAVESLLLAGAGLGIIAAVLVGVGLAKCGLFAHKAKPEVPQVNEGIWSAPVPS